MFLSLLLVNENHTRKSYGHSNYNLLYTVLMKMNSYFGSLDTDSGSAFQCSIQLTKIGGTKSLNPVLNVGG